jgi:hypothetical protein
VTKLAATASRSWLGGHLLGAVTSTGARVRSPGRSARAARVAPRPPALPVLRVTPDEE